MAYGRNNWTGGTSRGSEKYVGTPYNFVPFRKPVSYTEIRHTDQGDDKEAPVRISHNDMEPALHSGEIEYTVVAKTHLFVSDGTKADPEKGIYPQFVRDLYGRKIIPGSTMRGMIRNNVQILSMSDVGGDVDDVSLLFRAVATGIKTERKRYGDILGSKQVLIDNHQVGALMNVRAGYITMKNGKYVIYGTRKKGLPNLGAMNYYVLNERTLIEGHLRNKMDRSFSFFFDDPRKYLQHDSGERFRKDLKTDFRGRTTVHYRGKQNKNYLPYFEKVGYRLSGVRNVIGVCRRGEDDKVPVGYEKGYVISSGIMQEKKAIYIIPEADMDEKKAVVIQDKDIQSYKIDFEKKKKLDGAKQTRFFALPEEGQIKPVFYVVLGDRTYFGFTPRLRLFYDHTTAENLKGKLGHTGNTDDFASSMFGFSRNKSSYKSKVSFSDAVMVGEKEPADGLDPLYKNVPVILAEPKSSSVADYLKQDGTEVVNTYNTDSFELRGNKQYWLHKKADDHPTVNMEKQAKMVTYLNPVRPGTTFRGKIRFHNLTKEELGLLLWSVRLEENSWMNIGQAKPYGYGAVKVTIDHVNRMNPEKAYDLMSFTTDIWDVDNVDVDASILEFTSYMEKKLNLGPKRYADQPNIRIFLEMKDPDRMPDPDKIRYMRIDAKEYQNRKALPEAEKVMKKK